MKTPAGPREQIGETDVFSTLSQKLIVWVWNWKKEKKKKKKNKKKQRREAEEQISCRTAEFAFRFLRFLFLYLYIWILSVAVEMSTRGSQKCLLYKDIKSVTQRRVGGRRRGAAVEQAAAYVGVSRSFPWCFTRDTDAPLSNQTCTGKKNKSKEHFQHLCSSSKSRRNSALGGHSSASMLAPKLRIDGDEIYSVRRRWPFKSASLRWPRLFSAVGVICVCTGWFLPIKCMWMYKCFLSVVIFFISSFVYLSFANRTRGSVELKPPSSICKSSSSEQLHFFFVRPAPSPPPAHPKPLFTP